MSATYNTYTASQFNALLFLNLRLTVPQRPYEVVLPVELLYEIEFNCSDVRLVGVVRVGLQDNLEERIDQRGLCPDWPTGCIVDNVSASCVRRRRRRQSAADKPRHRRRRRKRRRRRSRSPEEAALRSRRRRRRRRRHFQAKSRRSSSSSPLLAVQFSLATRLLDGGSPWPDDYHRAVYKLRTVYDDVEDQLNTGDFRLAQLERSLDGLVTEVDDSLTEAPLRTVCSGHGFEFNSDILLCGTTSFFSAALRTEVW